ncbi:MULTISPECIES: hypothetical protein [Chromobacterium]|uniref:Uncharacterized protein n=2 Tax=Chromobacterium aquaticum TaxID=467180 RepID=A0ABV8ZTP4_9NEIS|nr:hypothetical protein [Chromobacterium aquaticum]MCD5363865.1 hypothetical protein [Chromobacterium aquaticum]
MHKNLSSYRMEGLIPFRADFVRVVSEHVRALPNEEFDMLDSLSKTGDRTKCIANYASIEDRVAQLTCIDELSVIDFLTSPFFYCKASVVGYVAHKPVFYFNGSGIYQWGDSAERRSLSYWISYPTCPPGWEID